MAFCYRSRTEVGVSFFICNGLGLESDSVVLMSRIIFFCIRNVILIKSKMNLQSDVILTQP